MSDYNPGKLKNKSNWESTIIEEKFRAEERQNYISSVEAVPICTHDVFVVPKGDGGGRVVVDCSRPKHVSVNNSTDSVKLKFSYKSLSNVTDLLQQGDYLATLDIKDAYRAVNIHPSNRKFQGLCCKLLDGKIHLFEDNRLCMGLSSSPFIFSKMSDFVTRCMIREGSNRIVNYLDDFCLLGNSIDEVQCAQRKLIRILRSLGFYINYKKVSSPATTAEKKVTRKQLQRVYCPIVPR